MNAAKAIADSEVIIFDLFHTLVGVKSDVTSGRNTCDILSIPENDWNRLLWESSEHRLRHSYQDDVSIIRELAHIYDPSISDSKITEAAHSREARFRDCLKNPPAERVDIIRRLHERGHRMILLSNADVMEKRGWDESPFAPFFFDALFSCEIGHVKPEPDAYKTALQVSQSTSDTAVFVGDGGSNELQGAKAFGITTIMTIEIIGKSWPELISKRKPDADYIIGSLNELL
jgi:putative hydrolase of the HAD superfamily